MKYCSDHCDELKSHCKNGKSLESFCARIDVPPKIITEWYFEYPEFKEAVEMAPCIELLYWEEQLSICLDKNKVEFVNVIKSRIDNLLKFVTSPIKKTTYNELKENDVPVKIKQSDDLLRDFKLLGIEF